MVWKPNKLDSVPFKKGTIVINVRKLDNNSFEFQSKETGATFCTNYGWSLAENTPENVTLLKELEEKEKVFKQMKKELKQFRNQIKTLEKNGE